MTLPLAADGRGVIVAIDHPLYSWPCRGLEDREALLRAVVGAGADAVIVSYGTLRDCRDALGRCGADPQARPHDADARRATARPSTWPPGRWTTRCASGAAAVLTYVQVGTPFELAALQLAGRVAAAADAAGRRLRLRDHAAGDDPLAIAACCRTAAELGARVVKTSFPQPASAIADAVGCGIPVVLAGGDPRDPARVARRRGRRDGGRRRRRRVRPQRLGRGRPGGDGARPRPDRARRGGARLVTAPLRLGVVGTGDVAAARLPARARAAGGPRGGRRVRLARRRAGARGGRALARRRARYAGYADLLGDPAVDAILNLTPIGLHAEVTLAALRAGKHVYSEKPLAGGVAEARAIRDAAAAARARARVRAVRDALPAGRARGRGAGVGRCRLAELGARLGVRRRAALGGLRLRSLAVLLGRRADRSSTWRSIRWPRSPG